MFQDGTFDGISSGGSRLFDEERLHTRPRTLLGKNDGSNPMGVTTRRALRRAQPAPTSSPDPPPPKKATKSSKPHCRRKVAYKQFQVLLTLLPKAFSSFAHATCSLSVSRPYLALEGIYLPLCASIPKNTTLENDRGRSSPKPNRAVTFSGVAFQQTWARRVPAVASTDYNSAWGRISSLSSSRFIRN